MTVARYKFNSSLFQIIVLFLILLVLRIIVALFIDALFNVEKKVDFYYLIGENLAQGNGFVNEPGGYIVLHRAPLYPYLLASLYRFLGETNLLSIFFIQAAFDAGTGLLICFLGARICGNRIGLMAAILYALYPLSAYYTLRLATESMYTFVLLSSVASLVYAVSSENRRVFFFAGIIVGITALVRPSAVGLAPFLVVLLLIYEFRRLRYIAFKLIYFVLGFIIILTPWVVRNYSLTGHVIPCTTGSGIALWTGTNVRFDGRDANEMSDPEEIEAWITEVNMLDFQVEDCYNGRCFILSYEQDQAFKRAAIKQIKTYPVSQIILLGKKFVRLWFSIFSSSNKHAQPIVYLCQGSLLLFALYGAIRAKKSVPATFILFAVVLYTILIHTLIVATLRYSIPLVPILMIFAMVGLSDLWCRIFKKFCNKMQAIERA
jgi:hypothetical protein